MQWKEFLLGNRANKHLGLDQTQGQICGAGGDHDAHAALGTCIVNNQDTCEDFESGFFFFLRVFFFL